MSDKRKYSEDRTRLMLESFIDVMAAREIACFIWIIVTTYLAFSPDKK